jgi:hypothetical protein
VSEIDRQAHALQTIAKAVQIIAVQVSLDGVATALLNASFYPGRREARLSLRARALSCLAGTDSNPGCRSSPS